VFDVGGKQILVYPSAVATVAYDVRTGVSIWRVVHGGMNASARPVIAENGLVIVTNGMGAMVAVNPNGTGDITESNVAWTLTRSVAKKSSPLVIGQRLYMVNDAGIASCVDIENGNPIWQQRLGGEFSASPIFDGEKIFAFSEAGDIHIFKPGDQFVRLGQCKLGDGFKASPAVVGNRLILRSVSHLYCISAE
jgi:outer membrane protein assembly factor BamB